MKALKIKKGFTIMELIIVVTIISILTVGVVNNVNRQSAFLSYDQSIEEINSLIKAARNFTLSSRAVYDESQSPGEESYIPQEGYGVYVERSAVLGESRMILFANTSVAGDRVNQYDNGDLIEESIVLSSETVFDDLELINVDSPESSTSVSRAVILFRTPLAETFIAENDDPEDLLNSATEYDTLKMSFLRSLSKTGGLRTISINKTAGFPEIKLN